MKLFDWKRQRLLGIYVSLGLVASMSAGKVIFEWAFIATTNQRGLGWSSAPSWYRTQQVSDYTHVVQLSNGTSISENLFWNESSVRPRVFKPWPLQLPLPCQPPEEDMLYQSTSKSHNLPATTGFLFLKTYKTASSTSAGVNLRIARNLARRENHPFPVCRARFEHVTPWHRHGTLFANRTTAKSFLWAILREPTKRAISQFFHFRVSRLGVEPTDERFQEFLLDSNRKNYYIRTLSMKRVFGNETNYEAISNEIIHAYDFIGVTERIDESFVALSMLLHIPLSDVMYLSAKLNGGYDAFNPCTYIQPSFVSPAMKDFFQSKEWKLIVEKDLALYRAANRSLDLTIDHLGREAFEKRLAVFRTAQAIAEERCGPTVIFPCDKYGERHTKTDCIWKDSGCGASCLDQVALDLGIGISDGY